MAQGIGVIICYATCWDCKMGYHNPEPHVWWDVEDLEFSPERCKPLPEGACACNCVAAIENEEEYDESVSVQQ